VWNSNDGSRCYSHFPDDSFDDWMARDDDGHQSGHYATREAAELAAEAIARPP
jgi:hypothetical protein